MPEVSNEPEKITMTSADIFLNLKETDTASFDPLLNFGSPSVNSDLNGDNNTILYGRVRRCKQPVSVKRMGLAWKIVMTAPVVHCDSHNFSKAISYQLANIWYEGTDFGQ